MHLQQLANPGDAYPESGSGGGGQPNQRYDHPETVSNPITRLCFLRQLDQGCRSANPGFELVKQAG
jgi:hypothetical protein